MQDQDIPEDEFQDCERADWRFSVCFGFRWAVTIWRLLQADKTQQKIAETQ